MNGDDQQPSGQSQPADTPAVQSMPPVVAPEPVVMPPPEPVPQPSTDVATPSSQEVSWSASEFVAHEKNARWYGLLVLAAIVLAALAYVGTRDLIATVAVFAAAGLFGYVAGHQPRVLDYHLGEHGLTISKKLYPYSDFKSFFMADEGAFRSITLMPLRRFMLQISVYFAPEDEAKITGVLGKHLPMAPPSHDLIDRFLRWIKF
jgi:hypothetical protein